MDKLQSIKNCIDDHLNDTDFSNSVEHRNTKIWLEGWICGVTDRPIHSETHKLFDEAMEYLQKQYNAKQSNYK